MAFREFLRVIWRGKFVGLAVFAIVLGSALFYVSRQSDVYEATATIALLPASSDSVAISQYDITARNLLPTYGQIISSRSTLQSASERLPGELRGTSLDGKVSVDPSADSGVIRVTGRASTAKSASLIANVVATEFVDSSEANDVVELKIIDRAHPADAPVEPQPKLTIIAAIVLGLLLGAGAAVGWDRAFGRVSTVDQLADAAGVPVLGVLPKDRRLRRGSRVIVGDHAFHTIDESIREIRANLLFALGSERAAVGITSITPGAGKSLLAANLAVSIGEFGRPVVLIDADLRRPVQSTIFDVHSRGGLTSTVTGDLAPDEVVVDTRFPGVRVVPAGPRITRRSDEVDIFLRKLPAFQTLNEFVIIDSPPLQATADVRLIGVATDAIVLVVEAGSLRPTDIKRAIDSLNAIGGRVEGVVLTQVSERSLGNLGIDYGYGLETDGPDANVPVRYVSPTMTRHFDDVNRDNDDDAADDVIPASTRAPRDNA